MPRTRSIERARTLDDLPTRSGDVYGAERSRLAAGLGREIRRHRRRLGWSQRELARQINAASSTISRLERGLRRPRPTMLLYLAVVLHEGSDIGVDDLYFRLLDLAGDSLVPDTDGSDRRRNRRMHRATRERDKKRWHEQHQAELEAERENRARMRSVVEAAVRYARCTDLYIAVDDKLMRHYDRVLKHGYDWKLSPERVEELEAKHPLAHEQAKVGIDLFRQLVDAIEQQDVEAVEAMKIAGIALDQHLKMAREPGMGDKPGLKRRRQS